jgi:hypothetical protein
MVGNSFGLTKNGETYASQLTITPDSDSGRTVTVFLGMTNAVNMFVYRMVEYQYGLEITKKGFSQILYQVKPDPSTDIFEY